MKVRIILLLLLMTGGLLMTGALKRINGSTEITTESTSEADSSSLTTGGTDTPNTTATGYTDTPNTTATGGTGSSGSETTENTTSGGNGSSAVKCGLASFVIAMLSAGLLCYDFLERNK